MYRIIVTGWSENIQKIALVNLIVKHTSLSLSQSFTHVDAIMNDIQIVINCLDKQHMYALLGEANNLGISCKRLRGEAAPAKDISIEELKSGLTVGELKEFLYSKNLPINAKVLTQRIEDSYFEDSWTTVKKEGEQYYDMVDWNNKIDSGYYLDKKKFPLIKEENLNKWTKDDINNSKDEFIPAWCCVKYENDENLYLHLHY